MKKKWFRISALALGLLLAMAVGVTRAQGPKPPDGDMPTQGELSIAGAVESKISYQGMLEESGQPVSDSRDMVFRLYSDSGCTTQVGSDITENDVPVADGLFSVELPVDQADFNGQGLWLRVLVEGTPLGCQEILPVPYALSLRPGATIKGMPGFTGALVKATSDDGSIKGSLVQGLVLEGAGVYGESSSSAHYGGYFVNTGGGYAGFFSGDVGQSRTSDGLVKAAVKVYCGQSSSTVYYYFNNVGSSITVSNGGANGRCTIDFNFDLTNRYWSATSAGTSTVPTGVSCSAPLTPNDTMGCVRWYDNGSGVDGQIMVVVY
ncbi:MAG: hypothetical protein JXA14_16930 [Anaerolineae bacterium]|nr:hypothetical protein [Anaerolineae bacterium]